MDHWTSCPVLGEFRLHAVENSNQMRFDWILDKSNSVSDSEKPEGTAINSMCWLDALLCCYSLAALKWNCGNRSCLAWASAASPCRLRSWHVTPEISRRTQTLFWLPFFVLLKQPQCFISSYQTCSRRYLYITIRILANNSLLLQKQTGCYKKNLGAAFLAIRPLDT